MFVFNGPLSMYFLQTAAVALMETLHLEIQASASLAHLRCFVLCPGVTKTNIVRTTKLLNGGARAPTGKGRGRTAKRGKGRENGDGNGTIRKVRPTAKSEGTNSETKKNESTQISEVAAEVFQDLVESAGMRPAFVADETFTAIRRGRFYIVVDHPDPRFNVGATDQIRHNSLSHLLCFLSLSLTIVLSVYLSVIA